MYPSGSLKSDVSRVFLMSSHAEKSYLEIEFQDGVGWFWKEKQGLSESFRSIRKSSKIPMSNLIQFQHC
jgi:tRNA (cytidine/uridine-2'-O-)-methyltransferase